MKRIAAACALLLCAAGVEAQAPKLDLRALAPQADTFAFQANGQTFGTQVVTLVRAEDGGFIFREKTTVPNAEQSTEVLLDAAGALRSTRQEGVAGGQEMRISVDYANGRASGHARVPQPDGMKEVHIDASVPANAVDDNTFLAMLQAMPWTSDAVFEVPVFASGKNELATRTLRVTGTEDVEVAGGTRAAYRVEVSGAPQLVVFVAASAPHRLLRMEVVGTPMVLVRTNGN